MTATYKIALAGAAALLLVVLAVLILRGQPEESDAQADAPQASASAEREAPPVPSSAADEASDEATSESSQSPQPTVRFTDDPPVDTSAQAAGPSLTVGRVPFGSDPFEMEGSQLYAGEGDLAGDDPEAAPEPIPLGPIDAVSPSPSATLLPDASKADTALADADGQSDPASAATQPATRRLTLYTIQSGDTFSSIAQARYGSGRHWVDIARTNPLVDPNALRVGQEIKLPPRRAVLSDTAQEQTPGDLSDGQTTYTAQPGDSLSSIARQFYNRPSQWKRLHEANRTLIGEDPAGLEAGMRLVIPGPANAAP